MQTCAYHVNLPPSTRSDLETDGEGRQKNPDATKARHRDEVHIIAVRAPGRSLRSTACARTPRPRCPDSEDISIQRDHRQVFWLTDHPTDHTFSTGRRLLSHPAAREWFPCGVRPRSQRRVHGGFAPPSLKTPAFGGSTDDRYTLGCHRASPLGSGAASSINIESLILSRKL